MESRRTVCIGEVQLDQCRPWFWWEYKIPCGNHHHFCSTGYPHPTPSCLGANMGDIHADPTRFTTLDVRRRRVKPTAVGRRPPSFLRSACKLAPKKTCRTGSGTPPDSTWFTKLTRDKMSSVPDSCTMSWICCGRRPSGPTADQLVR